jgi:hypothetical protein
LVLANRFPYFAVSLDFFDDICIPGHLMQFGTERFVTILYFLIYCGST